MIRVWRHPLGIDHVFVLAPNGACIYAGYVGWLHRSELWKALYQIREAIANQHCPETAAPEG